MSEELHDELEVLVAILEDDIKIHDDNISADVNIVLKLDDPLKVCLSFLEAQILVKAEDEILVRYLPPIILSVSLPEGYPEKSPPEFTIDNTWMTDEEKKLIAESLKKVRDDNIGQVILYDWITHIQDNFINIIKISDKLYVDSNEKLNVIEEYNNWMLRKEYDSAIHQCEICLTDLLGKQFEVLSSCSHAFCHSCLGQYCETHIKDGSSRTIDCPDPSCRSKVEIGVVHKLVSKELFEKYDMNLLTFAIRSMSGSVWCPILDCQQAAQVFSLEPHLGKCPVCLFVFCMDCNKASHGNSTCEDHGRLRTDPVGEDVIPLEETTPLNKDFEIFQAMVKRLGAKKTQDYLQKTIHEIFGHLSEDEHRDLVTHYIEASPEEKEKFHAEYGKAYLQYFLSGLRGTQRQTNYSLTRFTDFLLTLEDEKHRSPSHQMGQLLKDLEITTFAHGLCLQPCPSCFVPIEKNGGCQHMCCANCGVHFCWGCMQTMEMCTETQCGST